MSMLNISISNELGLPNRTIVLDIYYSIISENVANQPALPAQYAVHMPFVCNSSRCSTKIAFAIMLY